MVLFIDGGGWQSVPPGQVLASYLSLSRDDMVCWSGGYYEAGKNLNRLELCGIEEVVVFVHLSILFDYSIPSEDWMDTFDVRDIVRLIRQTNPEARVVVYSGELELPVKLVVGELGADGYVSLPDEEVVWKYFADKGSTDEEERRERGKSVEVYGRGRYNPEGLNMRHRCVERDRTGD